MRIIVFRSAPWYNVMRCCSELKAQYDPIEWITVSQENIPLPENLFPKEKWKHIVFPVGTRFDRKSLSAVPAPAPDDIVVIPFNNASGEGYSEFLRCYSQCRLLIFLPDYTLLEPSRVNLFLLMHPRIASTIDLFVSVPLALLLLCTMPYWAFRWLRATTVK